MLLYALCRLKRASSLGLVLWLFTCGACSSRVPHEDVTQKDAATDCTSSSTLDDTTLTCFTNAFLSNRAARRDALEQSLLETQNTYARERLSNYAVAGRWEALPAFDPPTAPLLVDADSSLYAGRYTTLAGAGSEGDDVMGDDVERDGLEGEGSAASNQDEVARSLAEWVQLGRQSFFRYPAQRMPTLELALPFNKTVSLPWLESLGLVQDETGALGNLRSVRYVDGSYGVALTCATCHTRNHDGVLAEGAPSTLELSPFVGDFDWAPGTVDVTADNLDNPVAIADLRVTRFQTRLHHTGNLANSLLALAVRIETLLITNNHAAVRPPRDVAFGLAVYIWQLGAEFARGARGLSATRTDFANGAELYDRRCRACHTGEWGQGDWVTFDAVGTEPWVANSPARGTGGYRVPALLGFASRRLTHEAKTDALEVWLNGRAGDSIPSAAGHAESTTGASLTPLELGELTKFLLAAF